MEGWKVLWVDDLVAFCQATPLGMQIRIRLQILDRDFLPLLGLSFRYRAQVFLRRDCVHPCISGSRLHYAMLKEQVSPTLNLELHRFQRFLQLTAEQDPVAGLVKLSEWAASCTEDDGYRKCETPDAIVLSGLQGTVKALGEGDRNAERYSVRYRSGLF